MLPPHLLLRRPSVPEPPRLPRCGQRLTHSSSPDPRGAGSRGHHQQQPNPSPKQKRGVFSRVSRCRVTRVLSRSSGTPSIPRLGIRVASLLSHTAINFSSWGKKLATTKKLKKQKVRVLLCKHVTERSALRSVTPARGFVKAAERDMPWWGKASILV